MKDSSGNCIKPFCNHILARAVSHLSVWVQRTVQTLAKEGVSAGLPKEVAHKIDLVRDKGLAALEMAAKAGVKLAYGTDLLGAMHRYQLEEFVLRAQIQPSRLSAA